MLNLSAFERTQPLGTIVRARRRTWNVLETRLMECIAEHHDARGARCFHLAREGLRLFREWRDAQTRYTAAFSAHAQDLAEHYQLQAAE